MKFSPSKHFWAWFRRNSQTLLEAQLMNPKEQQYWLYEINAHLRACSKKLSFQILWDKKGISRFIISAHGNTRYFLAAERLAAKAPDIPGWKIIGLQPPNLLPQQLMEQEALQAGIILDQCWMLPPDYDTDTGKAWLNIYIESYTNITKHMENAVDAIVCNILGEKIAGSEFEYIDVYSIFYLDPQDQKLLIKLEDLPAHIRYIGTDTLVIDPNGKMSSINKNKL